MRAKAPVTRVGPNHVTVRTEVVADDGTELPPLEVRVPIAHADLLDPTAGPGAIGLATAAAARGEDLVVEGPVDAVAATAAAEVGRLLSTWWVTGSTRVTCEDVVEAPSRTDGGVGLFFSRGVDSWSTLLDLLDEDPPDRVTHLVTVHHGPPEIFRAIEAAHVVGHRAVADELGLPLIVVETTIRRLLDPFRIWNDTCGPALVAAGLQVGAGLRTLVLTGAHRRDVHPLTGTDPRLIDAMGTTRTVVELGNPGRSRDERLAHLSGSPLARSTLQVCWEGLGAGNCGRCRKCQITMASLLLAGVPDPTTGFDAPIDLSVFPTMVIGPELATFIAGMIDELPAEHEELRRAISDAWDRNRGVALHERWGDDAEPALAGPSVATRVAAARRATTGHPAAPIAAPLGWGRGATPLRPPAALHASIRALAATAPTRERAWAVVEPHIRSSSRDGQQAELAAALAARHGAGIAYVPGILWDHTAPPVLDTDAVGALLRTARARLWWRPDGGLDALRVVETIEHGCLPLQVMPPGAAGEARSDLPPALAALVLAEGDIATLDLTPAAVATRLAPALDVLLASTPEHDLRAPGTA